MILRTQNHDGDSGGMHLQHPNGRTAPDLQLPYLVKYDFIKNNIYTFTYFNIKCRRQTLFLYT